MSCTFVGGANVDRIARLDGPHRPGASNPCTTIERPGGASLNAASVMAALGGDARLLAPVGRDGGAAMVRDALAARGVGDETVALAGATGSYTSIVAPDGSLVTAISDMAILDAFSPAAPEAAWLCVDANLRQSEIEQLARGNAGSLALMSVSQAKAPRLSGALEFAEVLFTNVEEARAMAGQDDPAGWLERCGARACVVSDGAAAVRVWDGDAWHEIEPPKVPIVDVIGAGDALAGGTLAGLMRGMTLVDAARLGIAAAGLIVGTSGPYTPDLKRLEEQ